MNNLAQSWLNIQYKTIEGGCCALFLLSDTENNTLRPAAQYPTDSKEPMELIAISRLAVSKTGSVVNSDTSTDQQSFDYFALPIFAGKQLIGVIAVKTINHSKEKQQKILDTLAIGSKWLELSLPQQEPANEFYGTVVKLAAGCLEQETISKALTALITEMTTYFDCERVSIGEITDHHAQVIALSNSAKFDSRANLIRTIAGAMDEAVDQDMIIVYPAQENENVAINNAHAKLARKFGSGSICTIPLVYEDSIFAIITLERKEEEPFDPETVRLCEQTMALVAPFIKLKQDDERWLGQKIWGSGKNLLSNIFGLHHLGIKLIALILIGFLSYAGLTEGDFRIHADAILEGRIQRSIAAPMEGFIASATVRAGDTVEKGEIMASLEDTELKLEKIKLKSERQQLQREYRQAMADRDLVQVRVFNAQIAQAGAKIKLIQEQLQRIQITAPFDGIVIEGDLSQSLGSPVERGDSLFKIAPLEGYRVILKVNERLISYIRNGQQGYLALSSMPERKFPLRVEKITAVANAEDGSNIFRVEAALPDTPKLLRPGMEGIGKIEVGQAKLLWIWTHELVDWVKLWVWSWWP